MMTHDPHFKSHIAFHFFNRMFSSVYLDKANKPYGATIASTLPVIHATYTETSLCVHVRARTYTSFQV